MKRTIAKHNDREIVRNLQAWIDIATRQQKREGKAWYKEAQKFTRNLSKIHKVDKYIVAAVTSALSPNNKWLRNKLDANALIAAFIEGQSINSFRVCTYTSNKLKAWRIMEHGEEIAAKSPKTHAFAMNIGRLSEKHVTIDKWHIRACLCQPSEGIVDTTETVTGAQYRRIEAITARLAEVNKLKAYELQAVIWVAIKQKWGR
jgi:thermostable 8-oxoguanine DNA glycosylase